MGINILTIKKNDVMKLHFQCPTDPPKPDIKPIGEDDED